MIHSATLRSVSRGGTDACPHEASARSAPHRAPTLMRRYEATALVDGAGIEHVSITAPAIPVFEQTAAAFARGTLLRTTDGPVAIEDLLPGDRVETDCGPQEVVWIGSTAFVPGLDCETTSLRRLTRIVADAMGPGRPPADLIVGPAARMAIDRPRLKHLIGQSRVLVPVSEFVDGDRFVEIAPGGSVQLYHVALRRHAVLRVGDIELESYHPGTEIRKHLGAAHLARFLQLFPHVGGVAAFGDLCAPRTTRRAIEGLASG